MKKGSVIVDLAAENGGNCALTEPGQVVEQHGVTSSATPICRAAWRRRRACSSATTCRTCSPTWAAAASFHVDLDDEVVRGALVLHDGELLWPPPRTAARRLPPAPKPPRRRRCRRRPDEAGSRRAGVGGAVAVRGRRRVALVGARPGRAAGVPRAPHRVRARLLRRLAGGLERHAGAAHAADERHQRDQRHHRDRRHAAGQRPARRRRS